MEIIIDPIAIRVLGCLIEKEVTTPDYYPMSLNALINACNQKSNRDPVMHLSEVEVECALDLLRSKHLVWQRSISGARVIKYEHNIKSIIPLSDQEQAILCVLFLRGMQTIGEIKTRTERLYKFISIEEVERIIRCLIEREDGPFIKEIERQKGHKEPRFIHLLCGEEWVQSLQLSEREEGEIEYGSLNHKTPVERIHTLEDEILEIKKELSDFKEKFLEFKKLLE